MATTMSATRVLCHLRISEFFVRLPDAAMFPILSQVATHGNLVRILVVEDEPKIAAALREGLEAEDFEVRVAATGEEGFYLANEQPFDLVLLDLMLPSRDGIDVLTTLRKRGIQTPVLILTAKNTVEDRVHGLDKRADDYLVKPFAFSEVLARIRALLRRGRADKPSRLQCEDLEIDLLAHKASRGGRALEMTPKE